MGSSSSPEEKFKNHKDKAVDVAYREIYRTTYDTKEGKKRVVERVLVDYDFLEVILKNEEDR